ncbi:hypothetical protein [Pseudohaliea sp.]|uniref:hypothetical protein n=1 Tax=Pseudohaliea sp. TaxID=2740289 RepID=UPI0032EB24F8
MTGEIPLLWGRRAETEHRSRRQHGGALPTVSIKTAILCAADRYAADYTLEGYA